MESIKKFFKDKYLTALVVSICSILLGLCAIIFPNFFANAFSIFAGIVLIVFSLFLVFTAITFSPFVMVSFYRFMQALLMLIIGIVLVSNTQFGTSVISCIFGLWVLINGLIDITSVASVFNTDKYSILEQIGALLEVAFGIIILVNPFTSFMVWVIFVGCYLVLDGAYILVLAIRTKKFAKEFKRAVVESNAEDVSKNDDEVIEVEKDDTSKSDDSKKDDEVIEIDTSKDDKK
jgi:uncharacterized membrane protein HdeD (DUF308 family)